MTVRDSDTFIAALRDAYRPDAIAQFELRPGDHKAIAEMEKRLNAARVLRKWLEEDAYARAAFNIEWDKAYPPTADQGDAS